MKKSLFAIVMISMLATSCSTLSEMASTMLKPSNLETISALKSILNSSTFKALNTLKNVNDNGIAGVLPKEIQPVLGAMKTLGYGGEIDKVTNQIKSISGAALNEGQGIMGDAIKEIKFTDAAAVVLGGEDAATEVLRNAMYTTVKKRYTAQLDNQLQGTEAGKYWPLAAGAYNMFSDKKINGSLSDILAEKAVDALFLTVGKEEKKIRSDYKSLGNQVVNKVFDYYVGGKK